MATRSPTRVLGDTLADGGDDADAFVPGDERRSRLDRPVAVGGMDVGVAEPGRLEPDDDLSGAGGGDGPVFDAQRRTELVDDSCFHDLDPPNRGSRNARTFHRPSNGGRGPATGDPGHVGRDDVR